MRTGSVIFLLAMALVVTVRAEPSGDVFRLLEKESTQGVSSRDMTSSVSIPHDGLRGPSLEILLWRGECRLQINLRSRLTPFADARWPRAVNADDSGVVIADARARHRIFENISGLEWEIVLLRHPDTNVFSFDMISEGLVFHFQDSLTEFEIGQMGAKRPDSVIGAFVAYRESGGGNRVVIRGTDTMRWEHGTGQAFIIYRPRAWDRTDTVWCDLLVDRGTGRFSIEVDRQWLERADYPVTIDPTFGNTSIGASSMIWSQAFAYCHFLTGTNTYVVPSGKTAEISRYSIYGSETGSGDMGICMAAFAMADGLPDSRVATPATVSISGGTPGWFHSSAVAHSLETAVEYGVAVSCAPRSGGTVYYNDVSNSLATDNTNCDLGSTNWTHATGTHYNFSMYATYTEYEAPPTPVTRRRRGVLGQNR